MKVRVKTEEVRMPSTRFLLAVVLCMAAVVGQATDQAASPNQPASPDQPAIADQPVNESDYLDSKSCISLSDIKKIIVIDERHIALELHHGKYVLNQLRQACQNMDADSIMSFNTLGTALCNLDTMGISGRATGRTGSCNLGRFEAITKEQLAAIRESARQRRVRR